MIGADVWGVGKTSSANQLILSVGRMAKSYKLFLKTLAGDNHNITPIGDITADMVGTATKPSLNLKAAETNGFLRFLCHMFEKEYAKHPEWGVVAVLRPALGSLVPHAEGQATHARLPNKRGDAI